MSDLPFPPLPSPPSPSDDPDDYVNTFVTAPSRSRRDGWTVERQRLFITALRETGVISVAAASVGMTHQSAYRLRNRADATGLAEAWDRALTEARGDAMEMAIQRSADGYWTPRFYRGRFVRLDHRYDVKMMIAALRASHARAPAKGDK